MVVEAYLENNKFAKKKSFFMASYCKENIDLGKL